MFDLNEVVVSSSYARGNENNAYKADGVYYLGPGVSPGYAITNFRAHYDLTRHFQLAVQIDNLFNHEYYTAALLANTELTAQGASSRCRSRPTPPDPTPEAPRAERDVLLAGRPRRAWVELRSEVLNPMLRWLAFALFGPGCSSRPGGSRRANARQRFLRVAK